MVQRPLYLVLLVACGATSRSTVPPPSQPPGVRPPEPPPPPPADAAVEGRVTDSETGAGVQGATVFADDTGRGAYDAAITDDNGSFHLDVRNGHRHISAIYADATVDGGWIDVATGGVVTISVAVPHAAVVAPSYRAPVGD